MASEGRCDPPRQDDGHAVTQKTVTLQLEMKLAWWWRWAYLPAIKLKALVTRRAPDKAKILATTSRAIECRVRAV